MKRNFIEIHRAAHALALAIVPNAGALSHKYKPAKVKPRE